MSKLRAIAAAALVAAIVTGGVATASAFAEGPLWVVNGKKLEAGETRKAEGKGTLTFVASTLLKIECGKLTEKMEVIGGDPGTDEDILEYSECTVVVPAGCKVKQPIVIEALTKLVYLAKAAGKWEVVTKAGYEAAAEKGLGDEFTPKAGETLSNITLEGCAREGVIKLKGKYVGLVNNGLNFSKETGENIKFGSNTGYVSGLMEYFIVNEAGEATGESFAVTP